MALGGLNLHQLRQLGQLDALVKLGKLEHCGSNNAEIVGNQFLQFIQLRLFQIKKKEYLISDGREKWFSDKLPTLENPMMSLLSPPMERRFPDWKRSCNKGHSDTVFILPDLSVAEIEKVRDGVYLFDDFSGLVFQFKFGDFPMGSIEAEEANARLG